MKRIILFLTLIIFVTTGCQQSMEKLLEQERYEDAYKACKTNDEKKLVLNALCDKGEVVQAANLVANDTEEVEYYFDSLNNDVCCKLLSYKYHIVNNGYNDATLNLKIFPKKGYEKLLFTNMPRLQIEYDVDLNNTGIWTDYTLHWYLTKDTIKKFIVLSKHGEFDERIKFRELFYDYFSNDELSMQMLYSYGMTENLIKKYVYSVSKFSINKVTLGYQE